MSRRSRRSADPAGDRAGRDRRDGGAPTKDGTGKGRDHDDRSHEDQRTRIDEGQVDNEVGPYQAEDGRDPSRAEASQECDGDTSVTARVQSIRTAG